MTALLRVGTKVRTTDRGARVHERAPDKPEAIGTVRDHYRPYGRQSKDRAPPYYVTFETGEAAWYDADEVEPIRGSRSHSTKKSPAQLQREIDEALASRTRAHATSAKAPRAKTVMTAEQFNALAERSAETLRVDDFEALLGAVRKLQPRTIVGVYGDYGYKKGVAEGRFIRLAETSPIAAAWSRRAIVEEIVPAWQSAAPRQLDVSPQTLRALPKTRFKRS